MASVIEMGEAEYASSSGVEGARCERAPTEWLKLLLVAIAPALDCGYGV
jgi:hypothetical protein